MPTQVDNALPKVSKLVGLTLAGTTMAALLIGWAALLLWLTSEAVMTVVYWL